MKRNLWILLILWMNLAWASQSPQDDSPVERGNRCFSQGDLKCAKTAYEEAIRTRDNEAAAHYNLANVLYQQDKAAQAVGHYRAVLRRAPEFHKARQNLATALYQIKDFSGAIAEVRFLLRRDPKQASLWLLMGASQKEIQAQSEALISFERAYALDPQPQVALQIAELLVALQRVDEAVDWLALVQGSDANAIYAQVLLADLYESKGQLDLVMHHLRQALSMDPSRKWLRYRIAQTLYSQKKILLAIHETEMSLRMHPEFLEVALLGAQYALELKQFATAERLYRRAVDLGSPQAVAGLHQTRELWKQSLKPHS
jgi:tetratricopeptide (TPR) repeat protein